MTKRKRGFAGTIEEHAEGARRFLESARRNYARQLEWRSDKPNRTSCGAIEHMTDVIAEASIAEIEATYAGDKNMQDAADKLRHSATVKQRELLQRCRFRAAQEGAGRSRARARRRRGR
jgi:hypothetical protein